MKFETKDMKIFMRTQKRRESTPDITPKSVPSPLNARPYL